MIKPPSEIIKEPFYKKGTTYEITINPDDTRQKLKSEFRLREVITTFRNLAHNMSNQGINIVLYPEISEPQNVVNGSFPRIHFHGTVLFVDDYAVGQYLLKYLPLLSNISSTQINPFRETYWPKYITKQMPLMKYLCDNQGIAYPIYKSKQGGEKEEKMSFFQTIEFSDDSETEGDEF